MFNNQQFIFLKKWCVNIKLFKNKATLFGERFLILIGEYGKVHLQNTYL
jgi:hypothetical protein